MSTQEPTVLAVDIGTSSIRASVLSMTGQVLATESAPTSTDRGPGGSATMAAEALWTRTTSTIAGVSRGRNVVAIGVAAQLGLVLVDAGPAALTPILLWSDRTADPYVSTVVAALAARPDIRVGRRVTSELAAARLLRWSATAPEILDRAAGVLSLKDYLVARLTGELLTDPAHASYSLLYDVAGRRWSPELAEDLDLPADLLPPVRGGAEPAGTLRPEVAAACGLTPGTVVAVGGPDGTVGSIGAGGLRPGQTVDIAGSTDVLVHVTDRPVLDDQQVATTNAHLFESSWTLGGATGMTGGCLDWLAQLVGLPGVVELLALAGESGAAAEPDPSQQRAGSAHPPGSVLMDTALTGHRFPYWDLDRVGGIRGITPHTTAADLVRAAHEGAAFLVAEGLGVLARLGETVQSVTVVGGVARRRRSLELRANVWGVPVQGVSDGLATSRGAALLAAVAAGAYAGVGEAASAFVATGTPIEPQGAVAGSYADRLGRWRREFHHG